MGRDVEATVRCAEPGCEETALWAYMSKAERALASEKNKRAEWRCRRHDEPERVLGLSNPSRVGVLVVERFSTGQYWREEGRASGSATVDGPGFRAFAEDFPVGTQLVVTAQVVFPLAQKVDRANG